MRTTTGLLLLGAAIVLSLVFRHGYALVGTLMFSAIVGIGATLLGGMGGVITTAFCKPKWLVAALSQVSSLPGLLIILVATLGFARLNATLLMVTLMFTFAIPAFGSFIDLAIKESNSPCIQVARQNGISIIDIIRQYIFPMLAKPLFRCCLKLCAWAIITETSIAILGLDVHYETNTLAASLGLTNQSSAALPHQSLEIAVLYALSALLLLAIHVLTPSQESL